MSAKARDYDQIIEHIFFQHFKPGVNGFVFERQEIVDAASSLGLKRPGNLGDVIYTYRFRQLLPDRVREAAPGELSWIIRLAGRGKYRFDAVTLAHILPTQGLSEIKVPDATPSIITRYALGDEQALLAKLRYNRLIDIFSGVVCYSLQSHLRTSVSGMGQVETDELYVGVDRNGSHYVFPVQAKSGTDILSVVQIEQDIAVCAARFPALICRPIASQFMGDDLIALFELEIDGDEVRIATEKHYRLVPAEEVSTEDLRAYRMRSL